MKKIIYILMTVMVMTLTSCGSKDDDVVETVQPEVVTPEVIPEPEPEPVLTYKDYFPASELIGQSLEEISASTEFVVDEFEGEIQKYVIEGAEIEGMFYNYIFLFTNENDIVTSVEYDFFFGNLYDESVDLQVEETVKNLDVVYNLITELGGVEITDENSVMTIVEDLESGKLYEQSYYNSEFELEEIEVQLENHMISFENGMIITKSIKFDNGTVIDV